VHLNSGWAPFVPRLHTELRSALSAWAALKSFPPTEAPYDDFAIHLRCGDVLARGIKGYGVLPVGAMIALIPPEARTVGIITQDWESKCQPGKSCSCQCKRIVNSMAELIEKERKVTVKVRADFEELASWARLAFAPMGTVCSPSTFCLYPTLAAARGFWALDKSNNLFPAGEKVSEMMPSFNVISMPIAISYNSLHGGHRRGLRELGGGNVDNSCSNGMGESAVKKLTSTAWLPPLCKGEAGDAGDNRVRLYGGGCAPMGHARRITNESSAVAF
jgi:hypothetical protein